VFVWCKAEAGGRIDESGVCIATVAIPWPRAPARSDRRPARDGSPRRCAWPAHAPADWI